MIVIQLDGLLDVAVFGIPYPWVLSIGGVLALATGVFLRVRFEHRERRRDPFQPAIDWFRNQATGGKPERIDELVIDITPDDGVDVRWNLGEPPDRDASSGSGDRASSGRPRPPEEP